MSKPLQFAYESMGTRWEILVWDELATPDFNALCQDIFQQSKNFDETYSRFIKTSLVWTLASKIGPVEVPEDFMNMLGWYKKLYALSGKKLNPLIGYTISDLGYDADYSLIPKPTIRPTPDLDETVTVLDEHHISLATPVLFDFGALGKGYFVDKIARFLQQKNVKRFLVNGSGDIYYQGNGVPLQAGLEHPGDTTKVIGSIAMMQGAMCGSGTNRRRWDKYHHVIDPQQLSSPHGILATWVMADAAVLCDALATCLFFTDPEVFQKDFTFEYCILNEQYRVKRSPGFTADLY